MQHTNRADTHCRLLALGTGLPNRYPPEFLPWVEGTARRRRPESSVFRFANRRQYTDSELDRQRIRPSIRR